MNTQKNNKGFTIIEVVLVLAIAGLIFLMVFLALPALQRTQRDTQRKNDLSRFAGAITSFKSNNNGKLPWTDGAPVNYVIAPAEMVSTFVSGYLTSGGSSFNDPSTDSAYVINSLVDNSVTADATIPVSGGGGQIKIYKTSGADCTTSTPSAGNTFVVAMYVENGGRTCQNL